MYKILNKILGWDYVHYEHYIDHLTYSSTSRIHVDGNDRPFIFIKLYLGGKAAVQIDELNKVTWLTCPPEEYME